MRILFTFILYAVLVSCSGGDPPADVLVEDGAVDVGADLGNDAEVDADVGVDVPADTKQDAEADVEPDVQVDAQADVKPDAGVDVEEDTKSDVESDEGSTLDVAFEVISDPGCVPDCSSAMCGSDGCGGTCGSCVEGEVCTESQACVTELGTLCPPASGGIGVGVDDTIGEVVLSDCDGKLYSVHQLCARKAAWIYVYAGWCAPCQEHMNWAPFWYAGYSEYDFEAYVVVTDGPNFETVTPAYCQQIKANFNLNMPVLMDPSEVITSLVGTDGSDINIVLGQGAKIKYVGSNPLEFKAALDTELEIEE